MRRRRVWVGAVLAWLATAAIAAAQGPPRTVEQCYLAVATGDRSSEGLLIARELCDAAFGLSARPLAFRDPKTGACSEWWFDRRGRFEDADRICSLESEGAGAWKLACQWKGDGAITFVRLREEGPRFVRAGELSGRDVGEAFASLASCIEQGLAPAEP